jgi:hypothetical protein
MYMLEAAEVYQDQFEEKHTSRETPIEKMNWVAEPSFNLHCIEGFDGGSYDHLDAEMDERVPELGYSQKYIDEMRVAIRSGAIEAVLIAQGTDGQFYVWDGNHRVGMAHVMCVGSIPAWVGYQPNQ